MAAFLGSLDQPERDVFARRITALEAGIDQTRRPADVAAVAAAVRPLHIPGLSDEQARTLRDVVADAVKELQPRIQTNMWMQSAIDMLTSGGRFRSVYDAIEDPAADRVFTGGAIEAARGRLYLEMDRNYEFPGNGAFGTGTTFYGIVGLSDRVHAAAPAALQAARDGAAATRLNTGSIQFGRASLILEPKRLEWATYSWGDTGPSRGSVPGALEQLPDILATAMARHYRAGEPGVGGSIAAFGGDDYDFADAANELHRIIGLPRREAIDYVKAHLTSNAYVSEYVEAAVRYGDAADIRAVHVQRADSARMSPEELMSHRAADDALRDAAALRGIPIRFSDDPA